MLFFLIKLQIGYFFLSHAVPSYMTMDFDGVLVNSSMARQGSLFSLLHFFMMPFICFTADSVIPYMTDH